MILWSYWLVEGRYSVYSTSILVVEESRDESLYRTAGRVCLQDIMLEIVRVRVVPEHLWLGARALDALPASRRHREITSGGKIK